MPILRLKITDLIPVTEHSSSSDTPFTQGSLVRLKDSDKTWICTQVDSEDAAWHRLVSQEFFRLMLPYQPETRVVCDDKEGDFYILTEQVLGFQPLPEINDGSEEWTFGEYQRYRSDYATQASQRHLEETPTIGYSYHELGSILILAVLVHQDTLSSPLNLGIDHKNRAVMIDGSRCFSQIIDPDVPFISRDITPDLLKSLPIPDGYFAKKWLHYITDSRFTGHNWNEATYKAVGNNLKNLSKEPRFREEMNRTMLKILVMPNWFLDQFFTLLPAFVCQSYSDFFRQRRDELIHSALQNSSFQAYLSTPKALKVIQDFVKHVQTFKAEDTLVLQRFIALDAKRIGGFDKEVQTNFQKLRKMEFEDTITPEGYIRQLNWPKINKSTFMTIVNQRFLTAKPNQMRSLSRFFEQLFKQDSIDLEDVASSSLYDESIKPNPNITDPSLLFSTVLDIDPSAKKIAKGVISTYIRSLDDPFRIIALGLLAQKLQQDLTTVMTVWSDSYYDNSNRKDKAFNEFGTKIPGARFDLFQDKWDNPIDLLLKTNANDDNILMLAIQYEKLAVLPFLNLMKEAKPLERARLLTQANVQGYTPLTLMLIHYPMQAKDLLQMVEMLDNEDVNKILSETTTAGNRNPLSLANEYCPLLVDDLRQLAARVGLNQPTVDSSRGQKRGIFSRAPEPTEPKAKEQRSHSLASMQ